MATRPPDHPSPLGGESKSTRILIDLLVGGCVRISSVCLGRNDSVYAPLPDERAPAEIEKLLGELRQRLAGDCRRGLAPEGAMAALSAELCAIRRRSEGSCSAQMTAHSPSCPANPPKARYLQIGLGVRTLFRSLSRVWGGKQ